MDHPSPSSTFQLLFDLALQDYEKQTGTRLADHHLAKQLEACDSVESITAFLHDRACAFREFRGEDGRIMRSLKRVTHVLYTLSTNAALGEGVGLVRNKLSWELCLPSLHLTAIPSRESNIRWFRHLAYRPSLSPTLCDSRVFLSRLSVSPAGHQRYQCELRHPSRPTRVHRRFPQPTRRLHQMSSYHDHGGDNRENYGGTTVHTCSGDETNHAGPTE